MLLASCEQRSATPAAPPAAIAPKAEMVAAPAAEVEAEKPAPNYHYSPFYVQLEGGGDFHVITFKDVGLQRKDTSPEHPLLEVIAESLSYTISESELGYGPAVVSYDEHLTTPEAHLACGQNHLYVDVWKNGSGTFGYSLWSGCGEEDNFAWHELEEPAKGDTLADQVEPLSRSIAESIAEAKEAKCFQKHC